MTVPAGEPSADDRGAPDLKGVGDAVAIVVAREGRLPAGAQAAAEEAGTVVVVGSAAETAGRGLVGARLVLWAETGPGFRPGHLADLLAGVLAGVPLLLLPSSPDGRDLAPRLAAVLGRPLVAGAIDVRCTRPAPTVGEAPVDEAGAVSVRATVARLDDRVLVPVETTGPAVVTLAGASSPAGGTGTAARVVPLPLTTGTPSGGAARGPTTAPSGRDPVTLAVLEPDVRTMDLADARRVVAGGAGLAAGAGDAEARARYELLEQVAAALGASTGATRVVTDAGWVDYARQIGTTGVAVDPELYVAIGISGAAQHVGGLGEPRHVVSVNTDPACPMTAMADLGVVTDAPALLVELAGRLGVAPSDDRPPDRTAADA